MITKLTIATVMIGFFSPSLELERQGSMPSINISIMQKAEARRAGNRGGNRNVNRNRNRNTNVNRNRNVNRNVNVNVNRSNRYYGGGRRYGYYGGRPVLAFATGMAIGSVVAAATMPSSCTTVVANNVTYRRCSNTYYRPYYQGDTVVYKVVASPY